MDVLNCSEISVFATFTRLSKGTKCQIQCHVIVAHRCHTQLASCSHALGEIVWVLRSLGISLSKMYFLILCISLDKSVCSECTRVPLETSFLHDMWRSAGSVGQAFCQKKILVQVALLTYNTGPNLSCLESLLHGGINVLFHFPAQNFLAGI